MIIGYRRYRPRPCKTWIGSPKTTRDGYFVVNVALSGSLRLR